MSAASEAEAAALFTNMKEGVIQRIALEEMQWPQPPTPITVDNSTAAGLALDTIKANKSRAMDMRLHWIQDRAQQRQFLVTWAPSKLNNANYFTKLHAPIHHCHMCFVYLHPQAPLTNPAHLSHANLSCGGVLKPGVHPWAGNLEVTSIPQVDYSTSQQQLTSMHAEVTYLIKPPITTKPVVCTNWFVHDLASLRTLHQQVGGRRFLGSISTSIHNFLGVMI